MRGSHVMLSPCAVDVSGAEHPRQEGAVGPSFGRWPALLSMLGDQSSSCLFPLLPRAVLSLHIPFSLYFLLISK